MLLNKNIHPPKAYAPCSPQTQLHKPSWYEVGAKSRGLITTSFSVNGADVGMASVKENNALKGVWTQWAFLLCQSCLSIAACSAGMLSRWHTERQRQPWPFQVPSAEKPQWVHVWKSRFFSQCGH